MTPGVVVYAFLCGAATGELAHRLVTRYLERTADRRSLTEWEQRGEAFGTGPWDESEVSWRR